MLNTPNEKARHGNGGPDSHTNCSEYTAFHLYVRIPSGALVASSGDAPQASLGMAGRRLAGHLWHHHVDLIEGMEGGEVHE